MNYKESVIMPLETFKLLTCKNTNSKTILDNNIEALNNYNQVDNLGQTKINIPPDVQVKVRDIEKTFPKVDELDRSIQIRAHMLNKPKRQLFSGEQRDEIQPPVLDDNVLQLPNITKLPTSDKNVNVKNEYPEFTVITRKTKLLKYREIIDKFRSRSKIEKQLVKNILTAFDKKPSKHIIHKDFSLTINGKYYPTSNIVRFIRHLFGKKQPLKEVTLN